MKKLLCLLLLLLLPLCASAEGVGPAGESLPDEPQWQAYMRLDTRIRKVKDLSSRDWLGLVPENALVDVFTVDGDWCICRYGEDVGYIPHDRLYQFYRLTDVPLPGSTVIEGIATMTQEVFLAVDGYSGNTLHAGDILCTRSIGIVPMMRYQVQLPMNAYTFEPFVSAEESRPGDAIYGFTTFYNDSLGGKYPEARNFNIEEAVRRLQGITLRPGEKFSFNQYCGPYNMSNGYKYAKNISRDGYGYGGGVCQVSTTIFNAIQEINVTLDEWQLHSYNGVKYVPRNLDAAVASTRDFSFYNNEDFPLEMQVMAQNGVLTVIFRHGEAASEAPAPTDEPAQ